VLEDRAEVKAIKVLSMIIFVVGFRELGWGTILIYSCGMGQGATTGSVKFQ
jgi:hypothetical protein